jgi:hypothetical protein
MTIKQIAQKLAATIAANEDSCLDKIAYQGLHGDPEKPLTKEFELQYTKGFIRGWYWTGIGKIKE